MCGIHSKELGHSTLTTANSIFSFPCCLVVVVIYLRRPLVDYKIPDMIRSCDSSWVQADEERQKTTRQLFTCVGLSWFISTSRCYKWSARPAATESTSDQIGAEMAVTKVLLKNGTTYTNVIIPWLHSS